MLAARKAAPHTVSVTETDNPIAPLDLLRRLENLLRPGTVHAVDHAAARVRVASGELLTTWLPWFERRAGNVSSWCPPSVGEQCLLLCPGGELAAGLVLVGLHSDDLPPPSDSSHLHRTVYPDGARLEYDHQAHALVAELPDGGTASIRAPGGVTIDSPMTTITGACTVQGPLTYEAGMTGTGGAGASATITGLVNVTGDVVANGISLTGHHHGGVESGGSNTGMPS